MVRMRKGICAVISIIMVLGFCLTSSAESVYTPGSYTASVEARGGMMTVEVTVSEDRIESVTIVEHNESIGISDYAIEHVPQDIVTYQSLGIDTVAGCTITSASIIAAAGNALSQAGADVAALRGVEVVKQLEPVSDITTQVVVAGGGVSGLLAAMTAADHGADVVLIEKLPYLGGSLIVAGGGMVTVDSRLLDDTDIDDSLEPVLERMRTQNETSIRDMDYEFAGNLLAQTGATMDYIAYDLGLEEYYYYEGLTYFGAGYEEVYRYTEVLENLGATIIRDATVTDIIMNDGKAAGVAVTSEAGDFTVTADKVIIATGGASYDNERMLEANPELAIIDFFNEAVVGNTGDGFRMLEEVGALMGDGPYIKAAMPDYSTAFHFTWRTNQSFANQIVVNAEGNRIASESMSKIYYNTYMLRNPSPAYYAIFDTVNTDQDFVAQMRELSQRENPRIVVYAETIEELAEKAGIDPANLRATFDRYQQMCENRVDEDFGKNPANMIPYAEEGGYFAAYQMPASWGTIGGAMTDEYMRVLSEDGSVIENLFAVGENATSNLFADYYFGGFSLGYYTTQGRIAAETAVAEINAAT
ncbi:MAG: FAD-dependent oxidoreductase [Clostridia bacterium]|nr:FAD-dependent oxidoreductase [Clostridia bacterium]